MAERLDEAWGAVTALATGPRPDGSAPDSIRPLFAADPARFGRFSRRADGLLLDLSKTSITGEAMAALLGLARAADLEGKRAAMAAGEPVNATERRAVLHPAAEGRRGVQREGLRGAHVPPLPEARRSDRTRAAAEALVHPAWETLVAVNGT